jgi:hypothetical protein
MCYAPEIAPIHLLEIMSRSNSYSVFPASSEGMRHFVTLKIRDVFATSAMQSHGGFPKEFSDILSLPL